MQKTQAKLGRVLLDGKPCMVEWYDSEVIVWALPSGIMIQTKHSKMFAEGCRLPFVPFSMHYINRNPPTLLAEFLDLQCRLSHQVIKYVTLPDGEFIIQ